jgi:hypothetical protein
MDPHLCRRKNVQKYNRGTRKSIEIDTDTDRAEDGGEEVMQRDAKGLEPALREVGLEVRIAARLPKVQDRCKRSSYTKHHS